MKFSSSCVAALTAATTTLVLKTASAATQCSHGRLFLTDANDNRVFVFDLDDTTWKNRSIVDTHGIAATSRMIKKTSTDRFVTVINWGTDNYYNVTSDETGAVSFINTGVSADMDTMTLTKSEPQTLDYKIECHLPIHMVSSDLKVAQFCDGTINPFHNESAYIYLIDETKLMNGNDPQIYRKEIAAHHGVAVPLDDGRLLHSVPTPGEIMPNGFIVWNYLTEKEEHGLNEQDDASKSCKEMHGDAHVGDTFAFACNQEHGGVLVVNYGDDPLYWSTVLQYPSEYKELRAGGLHSHPKNSMMIADFLEWDDDEHYFLMAFDPTSSGMMIPESNLRRFHKKWCSFGYEMASGKLLFVLMPHGNLQIYEVTPYYGWVLASDIQVLQASEANPGEGEEPECGILQAGHGHAYVMQGTKVVDVDLSDMSNIKMTETDLGLDVGAGVHSAAATVAGVPAGFECSGPSLPWGPGTDREAQGGFTAYTVVEGFPVGNCKHWVGGRIRRDFARALDISADRVYVIDADMHETKAVAEVWFADAANYDVDVGKELYPMGKDLFTKLNELIATDDNLFDDALAAHLVAGPLTVEEPHLVDTKRTQGKDNNQDSNDDTWPDGAIAAVVVLGVFSVVSLAFSLIVFKKYKSVSPNTSSTGEPADAEYTENEKAGEQA